MHLTIHRPAGYSGIELRSVEDSLDYEPHFHEAYSIGMLMRGAQSVRIGGNSETAITGSVQFIEPFQVHANRCLSKDGFSFRHFEISPLRLLQILDGRSLPSRPHHIVDPVLFRSLQRAFDVFTTDDNTLAQDEFITDAIRILMAESDRSRSSTSAAPRVVARIRDFLHANYADPITLDSLAELANISRVHVSRIFKQHIGLPPHEYLVQLRVASAKSRIANGIPIAAAAAWSGFADQSHLTRHFKRVTRITPGAYAEICNKRSRH